MSDSFKQLIRIIVVSTIVGAASGTFWAALTTTHLSDYALELGRLAEPLRIAEERPRAFPSSYEEALDQLAEEVLPAVAMLTTARDAEVVSLFDERFEPALVLTSDGWMLSLDDSAQVQRAVTTNGVCEAVLREQDALTGAVFYRCDDQSLPVVAFGSGFDVEVGEQLFVVGASDNIIHSEVVQVSWGVDASVSSDKPSRRIILSTSAVSQVGAGVFDLSSKLVGIVEGVTPTGVSVLPIDSVLAGFNSLLKNDEFSRASLGVNAVNLSTSLVPDVLGIPRSYGALLYGAGAVEFGSAAADAGLLRGDIILSIDHNDINASRSLDERLLDYQPLDEVVLMIERDGEEIEVAVTLGE